MDNKNNHYTLGRIEEKVDALVDNQRRMADKLDAMVTAISNLTTTSAIHSTQLAEAHKEREELKAESKAQAGKIWKLMALAIAGAAAAGEGAHLALKTLLP